MSLTVPREDESVFSICVESYQGHRFRSEARRARQMSVIVKINEEDKCKIADGDHNIEAGAVQILGSLEDGGPSNQQQWGVQHLQSESELYAEVL